jgi:hypothetical protein
MRMTETDIESYVSVDVRYDMNTDNGETDFVSM